MFSLRASTSSLLHLCLFFVLIAVGSAHATTYYVSPSGNDGYSGLRTTSPWRTINNGDVKGLLQPGDTVIVAAGTYPQSTSDGVKLANCPGSASAPITYLANQGVVIDQSGFAGTSFGFRLMANMHHIVIDGFEIANCQYGIYFDGDGVNNWCYENTVRDCVIHDMHYADPSGGVWVSWCAGIYNSASRGNLIHNNVIYNVGTPGVDSWPSNTLWAPCIMSPVCQDIKIYNNTFSRAWAGVHAWEPGNSIVRNNIIHDMWKFGLSNHQGDGSIANSHNLYYSSFDGYIDRVGNISEGPGEISGDPDFVGAAMHDFALLPTSPAINAGIDVGLPYEGLAPDIGAIESADNPGDTIEVVNLGELRTVQAGATVRVTLPKVVTAASNTFTDGSYYIEEPTRVCGIRIVPTAGLPTVALGDRITLEGVLSTATTGERMIIATSITSKASGNEIGAIGIKCREAQTPGGPETMSLLARVAGWVTYKALDGSYAYIDDGSSGFDATGNKGIRVMLNGLSTPLTAPPAADQFASITGVVGTAKDGANTIRVLRPRSDSDMTFTSVSADEEETARRWVEANFGSASQRRPFSFTYGGLSSSSLLSSWTLESSKVALDANRTQRTLTYTDPATGLQLRCIATEYKDYPAVEWVLYFKNTGSADTPILSNVQVIDSEIYGGAESGDYKLYYAEGSHALPTDFQPKEAALTGLLSFGNFGGRSSDGTLPFFNLSKPDGGMMLGIGWSGQWAASFNKNSAKTVRVQAGMEITNLKLLPGEEIRTPMVLVLFYSGADRWRGNHQFRRILFDHFSPTPGGQPAIPPTAASIHGYVSFEGTTEANNLEGINNIYNYSLPVDTWWIDAGWFSLVNNNWAASVGNFDPDPARYPNGMDPVADAAHARGLKFLLWFEPERVMPNTWMYNTHPDWLISPPSNMPGEVMYMYYDQFHLLNLGNPAALAWLKNKISTMIGEIGIDIYRNDFNMYPLYYWRKGEASDRQGINEIRYVMGLYDYWDTLLRDHPNLLIDNCASGGRRIDLETLRRSVVLLPSDYLWYPIGQQCQTSGAAEWIPWVGVGGIGVDNYNFRSGMGTGYALAINFGNSGTLWTPATQMLNQYNSIQPLYWGDFYPLTTWSTASNVWAAWQFNNPETGKGIVQIFRRPDSATNSMVFTLRGLQPTATYKVTFADISGYALMRTGTQLMQSGLNFSLAAGGATYITYERQ